MGGMGGETPDILEIRKKRIEQDMESGDTPNPNLFTVLKEKQGEKLTSSMAHTYDLPAGAPPAAAAAKTGKNPLDSAPVELALNPEEVDLMDSEAMHARAEAALREMQANLHKEDLSDMVAEHAAKQSSKRKRQAAKEDTSKSSAKKYKEFKF